MNQKTRDTLTSLGLLVLRLGTGGLLIYGHGWGKLVNFSQRASRFSDPLGVGSPASLAMAVFAEVFCALALVVGLATRLAAAVLVFMFGVLVLVHHAADPFKQKELALIYLVPALALLLLGGGRLSLDAWIGNKLGRTDG